MQLKAFPGGWAEHAHRHCVWIVSPPDYVHSHAFDEIAEALSGAFSDLGGSAALVREPREFAGRAPIVFGANLIPPGQAGILPPDSIIVNMEQVSSDSEWFGETYTGILKSFPVLDYSPRNCANLQARGITHAETLGIGYHRSLQKIKQQKDKDIDVLFYGSKGDRRAHILNAMQEAGLKVGFLFGVYGAERDAAIARSKIVLNVHHYEAAVFEFVRVFYLLANATCVLTEGRVDDPDLEPYKAGLAVEPYEGLVERAVSLVNNDKERAILAAKGWDIMRRRPLAPILKALIDNQA